MLEMKGGGKTIIVYEKATTKQTQCSACVTQPKKHGHGHVCRVGHGHVTRQFSKNTGHDTAGTRQKYIYIYVLYFYIIINCN